MSEEQLELVEEYHKEIKIASWIGYAGYFVVAIIGIHLWRSTESLGGIISLLFSGDLMLISFSFGAGVGALIAEHMLRGDADKAYHRGMALLD